PRHNPRVARTLTEAVLRPSCAVNSQELADRRTPSVFKSSTLLPLLCLEPDTPRKPVICSVPLKSFFAAGWMEVWDNRSKRIFAVVRKCGQRSEDSEFSIANK